MVRYVDIELVMKNIQQLRRCTCSCSDGIVDDVEMMMDMAPTVDVIPIPEEATNGDVINAVFPSIETEPFAMTVHASTEVTCNGVKGIISYDFWKEWWNAPYTAGGSKE